MHQQEFQGQPQPQPQPQQEESPRQSWRAWAGQKIRAGAAKRRGGHGSAGNGTTEVVNVFPGWAVRRYNNADSSSEFQNQAPRPFELEVFVSGYAITHRSPENMSRAQRGFLRLAKGFASLPKIIDSPSDILPNSTSLTHLTPSTEALLASVTLPPRPTEITDDYDVEALERQLRKAKNGNTEDDLDSSTTSSGSVSSSSSSRSSTMDVNTSMTLSASGTGSAYRTSYPSSSSPSTMTTTTTTTTTQEMIKRLHANLEQRLQPFWASVLPNRTVRLHLFASPHHTQPSDSSNTINVSALLAGAESNGGPLASQDVQTAADGSFQVRFRVGWEELCVHPRALHIAFDENLGLGFVGGGAGGAGVGSDGVGGRMALRREEDHELLVVVQLLPLPNSSDSPSSSRISLSSPSPDNVIPGMGEWYTGMWTRGVRFHYVSNGPFELLPILNEFFELSQLPPGSIKLRSYAGRSLFNGLLSAPAARKRAGVVDVLDAFPESKFFLIGDSGEQDMELYADIARERPNQILAIFVRDANAFTYGGPEPLEDPTGWKAVVSGAAGSRPSGRPLVHNDNNNSNANGSVPTAPVRSDSVMTGTSVRNGHGVRQDSATPLEPPRPQFWSDGSAFRANLRQQQSSNFAMNKDGGGALSAEPEPADFSKTPRTTAVSGFTSSPSPQSQQQQRGRSATPTQLQTAKIPPKLQSQYITQPPPPTPPPTTTAAFPHSSSHSYSNLHYHHHPNSSTSSLSSNASTTNGYGGHQFGSATNPGRGTLTPSSIGAAGLSFADAEPPRKKGSKKRHELQLRVWRARTQIPGNVMLRVFRDPGECVGEAGEILDREGA
ncbi:hypothetical protein CPB84DRAFT_1789448 [Gymnopilus junonius]|uniref:Phosphatidate phosphatase APP1 catalytic domain-containing protein n=1 Tax=Gymnopilus junonius TaxID=109634 RepID=A0A9P5NGR7_GYMJU|nr:hypothetical protein CPB84DRAFT_1789448 [Gymnopilus junonius]